MNAKQVIVVRHDLIKGEKAVRRGKMMAQVAHASLGSLLKLFNKERIETIPGGYLEAGQKYTRYHLTFRDNTVLSDWLEGKFTKVVVYVPGETELLELNKALDDNEFYIPHALITDAGLTEFHGEPTVTCLGIGPYNSEEIDKFTGELPLL
jgi:PTH2 family peptidyl-tRNA hydrolase